MGALCVDSRFFRGLDERREGKGVGNCVLTTDCVRGICLMVE